jgi:hypothetical protein
MSRVPIHACGLAFLRAGVYWRPEGSSPRHATL